MTLAIRSVQSWQNRLGRPSLLVHGWTVGNSDRIGSEWENEHPRGKFSLLQSPRSSAARLSVSMISSKSAKTGFWIVPSQGHITPRSVKYGPQSTTVRSSAHTSLLYLCSLVCIDPCLILSLPPSSLALQALNHFQPIAFES